MPHIVLLGDSIFDNTAYVAGGPDVATQLRAVLPPGWQATLRAVDGATIGDIRRQLSDLPSAASYLVVSVGGNDALGQAGALDEQARSMAGALDRLAGIREQFGQDYRGMLEDVLSLDLPTAASTIYDARFPDPFRQRLIVTARPCSTT
jgi:hypothetical protein